MSDLTQKTIGSLASYFPIFLWENHGKVDVTQIIAAIKN